MDVAGLGPRRPRRASDQDLVETMDLVDVHSHRGEFFRVLQQTRRSQTAVMTIAPGHDAGPAETHAADQFLTVYAPPEY